jgi:MFS family permease
VSEVVTSGVPEEASSGKAELSTLLVMAMFVLVVDTSLMNVSISAVVKDLDTTVSGVRSAIALEALVSGAFILISSKVGDLIGRKRAYVIGLLAYAIGALAMTVAHARDRSLQVALLVPVLASLLGLFNGFRMRRLPDPKPASSAEGVALG